MDGLSFNKPLQRRHPNLFPPPPYCHKFDEPDVEAATQEKLAKRLEVNDPGRLLLLTESLFDNNTHELEKKLNAYIQRETEATTVFIVSLVSLSDEAVVQVVGQEVLNRELRTLVQSNLIIKEVCTSLQPITSNFTDLDIKIQEILTKMMRPKEIDNFEMITIPVHSRLKKGSQPVIQILISIVNSRRSQDFVVKCVHETFRFCLPILRNTSKFEEEARIKKQCQSLLHVARRLFNNLNDVNDLLKEIMSEAKRLTNSERCSLFLLHPDHVHLVAKVFDSDVLSDVQTEVKIAKDQGIAGHVAATGKLLNIKDAYQHPLFFKGMDEATGFHTRNILCFPIRDECGIVGVAQLCNKTGGDFDFFDEEVALAFSIYCGLSIVHSLVYKNLQDAQNRSKLSNELMLYHMKVSNADVDQVLLCTNRHSYLDFDTFEFLPKRVYIPETPCQVLRMFEDLKFIETFHIDRRMLVRFILYVKRGYRETPYHNWMHAFSVAHFAYVSIKRNKLIENGYLTILEAMSYILSSMCHDIDHRGTTNSFQLQSSSLLANLYSSEGSVMEHHHLSQSLCILNTEDCNFLACLSTDQYETCLDYFKNMILATDLANHFALKGKMEQMIEAGFNKQNSEHSYMFKCLLMTCADLCDQIKEWEYVKEVAKNIYNEFFKQGDMERAMGKKPQGFMDRENASIPELQVDFLTVVCLPVYTLLSGLFPEAESFINTIKMNMKLWEACKPVFQKMFADKKLPLDILASPEIDEEINKVLLHSLKGTEEEVEAEEEEAWG